MTLKQSLAPKLTDIKNRIKEQNNKTNKKTTKDIQIVNADSVEYLKSIPSNSIGSVVCDPPYGISYQNNKWDKELPLEEIWKECFRILKPGGYILAFSSARTYHHLAVQIENSGFTTHQMLTWVYSSGLPKGANLSQQIEKNTIPKPCDEFRNYLREAIKRNNITQKKLNELCKTNGMIQHYLSKKQPQYPSKEIWIRLKEQLNLDQTFDKRIDEIEKLRKKRTNGTNTKTDDPYSGFKKRFTKFVPKTELSKKWDGHRYGLQTIKPSIEPIYMGQKPYNGNMAENIKRWDVGPLNIKDNYYVSYDKRSRYPSNFLIQSNDDILESLENQKKSSSSKFKHFNYSHYDLTPYIYCSKPTTKEKGQFNKHPTVKPVKLMQTLVSLVTPFNEVCIDPFLGSGTTGVACKLLNKRFIGIEKDSSYFEIAKQRVEQIISSNSAT